MSAPRAERLLTGRIASLTGERGFGWVEAIALADEKIAAQLEGKTVRKVIVVPGKIVNIIAG